MKVLKFIKIPKDLSSDEIKFYTSMPIELIGLVSPEVWEKIFIKINKIIEKYEKPSFFNIFRYLLIFPVLFNNKSFQDEVSEFIQEANMELKQRGVEIIDPSENGYIEVEIIYYVNEE